MGSEQATRERLGAALAAAPDLAVYRIGRGADPLPVQATFDPADQPGCRSLLDWFERGAPSGAVLLVDDWGLCAAQDPELGRVVQWVAALGPARGVQTVVTARSWDELPSMLRRHLYGEATDLFALHGIDADLGNRCQRRDFKAAVGFDDRGWPVYLDMNIGGNGLSGTYLGPVEQRAQQVRSALVGLMVTHSSKDLNFAFFDMKNTGMFKGICMTPHVPLMFDADQEDLLFERIQAGLDGELNRRQMLVHEQPDCRDSWDYRKKADADPSLEPLPDLLICVDSAEVLIERYPRFKQTLEALTHAGRTMGIRMLYSGEEFPSQLDFRIPAWPSATPPHDFAEMADFMLYDLHKFGPPGHEIFLAPLHWSHHELALDMLPPGAIGLIDKPFEQRRDILAPVFTDELRHGAIVGKPGTGKTTALRMLAAVLGDDIEKYQLLDGPGEPLDPQRHIVVTANSWEQVPPFIRESLAFGIEFRLDDPARTIVDPREAARVPDRPGFGLSVRHRLHVQIAQKLHQ